MATEDKQRRTRWLDADLAWGTALFIAQMAGLAVALIGGGPALLIVALGATLLYLSLYDLKYLLLPDAVTLPLIATGLLTVHLGGPSTVDRVTGAVAGFAAFVLLNLLYRSIRHRDGLGLGDAKLAGAIGAWLGWMLLPHVLVLAAGGGLIVGVAAALFARRSLNAVPLPFGPFLAGAFFLLYVLSTILDLPLPTL